MRIRLLIIPIFLAAFALQAQTVNWVKKNGPVGGEVVDIEVDATTGNVFLLDGSGRPFRSIDNGASWQALSFTGSENNFRDIEISDGTIFLLGSDVLYASNDGGANFQSRMAGTSPFIDAYSMKRMPSSGNLVALCWNALYTSTNDGQTWSLTGVLSQTLYPYLEVNALDQIFILKPNPTDFTKRPFRSSDGGTTFVEQSTGIPTGKDVLDMAMDNAGSKLVCITNVGMYSSSNGTSWTNVKTAAISDEFISDYGLANNSYIEFSADGLGMFFVDNLNHKLYSKAVTETNWVLQSDAFPSGTLSAICASAKNYPTATSAIAFFGTEFGVFKTSTGGASVTQNNKGLASVRAQQIVADNSGNLFIKTLQSALLKSQDEGNNWARITSLPATPAYPLQYFFADPDGSSLYARVDVTLYRSSNQGGSWSALNAPSGGFAWAAATTDGKVFGLQNSSFYYSANNGTSWTAAPVAITGLPTSFSLFQSDLDLASPGYLLTFLFNHDEGAYNYYAIKFTYNAATGAIATAVANKITNFPIAQSSIHRVAAANGKFYVYGNSATSSKQIAISADGGATWVTRPVPASTTFITTKNGYLFFLNSSSDVNKIYLSRDEGLTFIETSMPSGVRINDVRDIAIDNSGFAYLAFDGGYLYQSAQPIVLPSPLTGLQQVGYSATAVALSWQDTNEYEHNVVIERSQNGADFINVGLVNGRDLCFGSTRNYFVDTNAQPATTYTYRIRSENEAGESAPTSTINVTTLADCAQTLPANSSWRAINSGTESYTLLGAYTNVGIKYLGEGKYEISDLSLSLTGSPEKSTFYVSCDKTIVGGTGDVNPNGNGTWDGTTLKLKWRACRDDKTETISLTLNAAAPIPEKPTALLAYVISNTSIELKWRSAYYEKSYVLERSTDAAFGTFVQLATPAYPTTTFVDDVNLVAGTTYYYRIKAVNGNVTPQASPYSDPVTVPLNAPNFIVAENAITDFTASVTLGSIWADFNNDGLEDYFTMQYDVENERANPAIFKNLGNGVFEASSPAVGDVAYTWPSVADIDNDNKPDLILAGDNTRVLDIFRGNGDFTFTKIPSGQLGDLAVIENSISSSSLADFNNDGLLDLLAINQEDGGFILYKQNADHSFTNVFEGEPNEDEPLLSIWADYDNDGFQDVLLGNLDGQGGLHRNNGDATFTLVTGNGMDAANYLSAAWGDYNNDGNIDLFCGSASQNALYKNNGNGTFTKDVSTAISEATIAISASWGDFNNDGFLDLITAGFASAQTRLFIRDATNPTSVVFKKIVTEKINDRSTSHYSVASADPDNNGLLDLVLSAFIFDDDNGDALIPTNNNFYQNNNAPANWSKVKLIPASGSTEAIGARITLTAGGKTQTREIATMSSLVSRNSTIAHFGLGSSTNITNIQVRWPNGSVQNYPLPPANELLLIDEDIQGPAITSKTPAHNATGILTSTTITLQFDENNLPVPGKNLHLTKTGESTPFASIDVTTGTKTGNQYVFAPPSPLEGAAEYNVSLDAGAFRDRYANPSVGIGPAAWKFTTQTVADTQAPTIDDNFIPLASSLEKGFSPISIQVTAADDRNVTSVSFKHRKISEKSFQSLPLNFNNATGKWEGQVLNTFADDMGLEYFLEASDGSNIGRLPVDNTYMKSNISFTGTNSPSIALPSGGTKTSWKVISIPHNLPASQIETIFSQLGASDKTKWRLIRYTNAPAEAWLEYPGSVATIERGKGYFINTRDGGTVTLSNASSPANTRDNLFQISLVAGWNQIGNPYTVSINWADVQAYNPDAEIGDLFKFNSGNYTNLDQELLVIQGGFVEAASATTIKIPFDGQNTPGGGRKGFANLGQDISAEEWALPMQIQQGDLSYTLGSIGMALDANISRDPYDASTPPRFFDYLELNFSHPEYVTKRFTRDIVATQQDYTWDFTVDSNLDGMATLNWNNIPLLSAGKDIFLLDVGSQQLINMKETGTYTFVQKSSSAFKVFYGDNLLIAPEKVQLGKAYPNPTNGNTTIAFSLPETGGLNQSVTLELMDPIGRIVERLQQGRFNPGYHKTAFDATHLMRGLYTYRLTVRNLKGLNTEVNKLIIK